MKSLDQLSRSGLRSRKKRQLKKLQSADDALRCTEVNDRTCAVKNKAIKAIQRQRQRLQAEFAQILAKLEE